MEHPSREHTISKGCNSVIKMLVDFCFFLCHNIGNDAGNDAGNVTEIFSPLLDNLNE
jgi:hypothetical protein